MPSDLMTTLSDKVRVIFPDGLPGGVDASQVKLMIQRQPHAEPNRDGHGAAANNRVTAAEAESQPVAAGACPATQPPPQAEPDPAPADPCTPTPPHAQDESVSVRLPSASCLLPSPRTRTRADASRENGRKSRGPITPEGKARSSQNALKHGLSSRQIVIETEDEEEWLEFRDECRQTFSPVGAIELGYADEFAASRWRLNRCLGIETSIFDHEFAMQKIYDEKRCSEMDDLAKTGKAFRSAQDNLTALGRYETRIRRSGERALTNLLKLQSTRQNKPNQPDEPETPDGDMLQLVPSGGESPAKNEPGAPSAGGVPGLLPTAGPATQSPKSCRNEPNQPESPDAPDGDTLRVSPPPSHALQATKHERGEAAGACPPTETPEAKRTQAAGHNPAVPMPPAFGTLHSSSAAAPVCEPAREPVQPSAGSASVLQNEPATRHEPAATSRKADSLVREPAPQPVQPSASSAAFPQNEPNELASRATLCPRGVV
jgi:hypothetical protein